MNKSFLGALFAVIATVGMLASLLLYIASFVRPDFEATLNFWLPLLCGVAIVSLPIYKAEGDGSGWLTFRRLSRSLPRWSLPIAYSLWALVVIQAVYAISLNSTGVPRKEDDRFVVYSRGEVVAEITQADYLRVVLADARACSSVSLALYYIPLVYWCRKRPATQE